MSNSTEIINKFDFCDGQIESISLYGDCATLTFCTWKEERYTFIFKNVVYLKCYELGSDITGVQIFNQSQEINEAVEIIKAAGGKAEGYNNFSFYQINFEGCCNLDCIIVFLDFEIKKL